jgi:nucleoside-diphosphate-sugar epimerase
MQAVSESVVWITGVNGFSGRHAASNIRDLDERITIIGSDVGDECDALVDDYLPIDVRDRQSLDVVVAQVQPTHVMHLAGALPPANAETLWDVNVGGTLNLISALATSGQKALRLLLVGSAAEYGASNAGLPLTEDAMLGASTSYGQSKLAQSVTGMAVARSAGITCSLVRTFNLLGPGISTALLPGTLAAQFRDPETSALEVGDVDCERDFVDIRDVVRAYWLVVSAAENGSIYNICSGKAVSVRQLINLFNLESGRNLPIHVDEKKLHGDTIKTVFGARDRVTADLGWHPKIDLRQSVRAMLQDIDS